MEKTKSGLSLPHAAIGIAILAAIVCPHLMSTYQIHLLLLVSIWLIVAISLNLLTGYIGKMSFAHAAFMGVAGYTSSILTLSTEIPWIAAAILGIVLSGLVGMFLGIITLRLKGHFFGIVTLAFGEIYTLIVLNAMELTNGPMGLRGIEYPNIFGFYFENNIVLFYLILAVILFCFWLAHRIVESQFGVKMRAVREDEDLAECMGIHTTYVKVLTFTISSMMAGLGGVFYTHYIRYISPDIFTGDDSTLLVLMVILGGMGTKIGPILGALVVVLLPQILYVINDARMIIFGVIIILVMTFMPRGLVGVFQDILKKLAVKKADTPAQAADK